MYLYKSDVNQVTSPALPGAHKAPADRHPVPLSSHKLPPYPIWRPYLEPHPQKLWLRRHGLVLPFGGTWNMHVSRQTVILQCGDTHRVCGNILNVGFQATLSLKARTCNSLRYLGKGSQLLSSKKPLLFAVRSRRSERASEGFCLRDRWLSIQVCVESLCSCTERQNG